MARTCAFEGVAQSDVPAYANILGGFIFGILGLFTFIGVVTPGSGGLVHLPFLIPFWAIFPVLFLSTEVHLVLFAVYLVGFPIAKLIAGRSPWYAKAARGFETERKCQHRWIHDGAGGGGWSGGGAGGGGFSGGGGSSGGGGALRQGGEIDEPVGRAFYAFRLMSRYLADAANDEVAEC